MSTRPWVREFADSTPQRHAAAIPVLKLSHLIYISEHFKYIFPFFTQQSRQIRNHTRYKRECLEYIFLHCEHILKQPKHFFLYKYIL
jgi:hypothetical protein